MLCHFQEHFFRPCTNLSNLVTKPKIGVKMADHNYTTGSKVEVRSDDEGFRGACYLATIVKNPEVNKYVVVYDNLMESEDKDSNPLTETVDVSCLRPLPPVDKGGDIIKLYDIVDAYHRDGWWKGEVIEILEEGNFLVYFQNPPDELIVHRDHLRLHLDWIHGKWQKPKKQVSVPIPFFLSYLDF